MKEFAIYTAMRTLLFLACFAVVSGLYWLIVGPVWWTLAAVIAFLISGLLSLKLLNPYREAFARRVDQRAARARESLEARRAAEDVD